MAAVAVVVVFLSASTVGVAGFVVVVVPIAVVGDGANVLLPNFNRRSFDSLLVTVVASLFNFINKAVDDDDDDDGDQNSPNPNIRLIRNFITS